jgi:hypothetical protein
MAAEVYLRFVGITTRIKKIENPRVENLEKDGRNFIYAIWHCQQVFLMYAHQGGKVCALVSKSRDGEYIARLLPRFGMEAVRGSTSKGGPQALLGLLDKAQQGFHPVITPDGPRGPARTVQQGVVFLAQKTGLPIVPVACGLKFKAVFNSWDRFQLPLPFGSAAIVYGNPVDIAHDADAGEAARKIQTALEAASATAEQLAAA